MSNEGMIFEEIRAMRSEISANHTEVVQRLTKLESSSHSPDDCHGNRRTTEKLDEYIKSCEENAKWDGVKAIAKEAIRMLAAIAAAITTTKAA